MDFLNVFVYLQEIAERVGTPKVTSKYNAHSDLLIHFCDLCVDTTDMLIVGYLTMMILN